MAKTFFNSYDQNGKQLSFANWISMISPQDTPFVSMTGKESINQTMFSWQTDALAAVDKNNAGAEGESVIDKASMNGSTKVLSNNTQILRKVVKVSDTANTTANYGRGRELMYQLEKAGKEIKRDLEAILLSDQISDNGTGVTAIDGNAATNGGKDTIKRKTAGFQALCATAKVTATGAVDKTKDGDADPDTGAVTVKVAKFASSADTTTKGFDEADLFDLTLQLYTAGSEADIIMINPVHAAKFAALQEVGVGAGNRLRMFENTKQFIYEVNSITDPLGQTYKIVVNRWMPADAIYFLQSSDWTQMVLRAPQRTELAKVGSAQTWMIEMEVGLRHRNPYASGILYVAAKKP